MPSYIVKADPSVDWYCNWSTVVDAPCAWGKRAELSRHLYGTENGDDRWQRADERGTSADWPDWKEPQVFGWEDEEFVLMEAGPEPPEDGCWMLPRRNLREFCERLDRDEDTTDLLRLEVYED